MSLAFRSSLQSANRGKGADFKTGLRSIQSDTSFTEYCSQS